MGNTGKTAGLSAITFIKLNNPNEFPGLAGRSGRCHDFFAGPADQGGVMIFRGARRTNTTVMMLEQGRTKT